MSKRRYYAASIILLAGFAVMAFIALQAYAWSGLPTDYGFVAVVPVALVWAWLQNRLKGARAVSQRNDRFPPNAVVHEFAENR